MKTNCLLTTAIAAMAFLPALAVGAQPECQSTMSNSKSVALAAPRSGMVTNFSFAGQLDPVPLLETTINTIGGRTTTACVTVTFSAQVDPGDNYGVYQASIDDVPMIGHGSLPEYAPTPIVFDAVNQVSLLPGDPSRYPNSANSRMVSYTFFASVAPGTHTIKIKVAGCCGGNNPAGFSPNPFVRAATVEVRW